MIDVVNTIARLENDVGLHLARLLILLDAFSTESEDGSVEGLTKLAKLDFLLRYPVLLERALRAKGHSTREVKLEDHEITSVESKMVRYRFGPWDHRYRDFLNVLIAKGWATVVPSGRTLSVSLTVKGRDVARNLARDVVFEPYVRRSRLLKRYLDLTATNLMRFIYDTFPEVVSLRSNEAIPT